MPRKRKPRALRRAAASARAEIRAAKVLALRAELRKERRLAQLCRSVPGYAKLEREAENRAVQARIDAMELAGLNADRAALGLSPLSHLSGQAL